MTPGLIAALVRWWTRAYTLGLPPDQRQRRCDEIESDLWEQSQDASGPFRSLHVLIRFITGIPADVLWRAEAMTATKTSFIAVGAAGIGFLVAALWFAPQEEMIFLPQPPALQSALAPDLMVPPPPPPPPPPPGTKRRSVEIR